MRYASNPKYEGNNFFFLGKKRLNGVTAIMFSQYESCIVADFMEKFINEINEAPVPRHDMSNLIPLFRGNKYRALENPGKADLIQYFADDPEINLASCKARIGVNSRFGLYELRFCCPVSGEISRQHHGYDLKTFSHPVNYYISLLILL